MRPGRRKKRSKKQRRNRKTFRQAGGNKPLIDGADGPATTGPPLDFNVRFQPSVKAREDGPVFTIYQVAHEPYPVWTAPTPPTMYTILCWDPDAVKKSFLHWLIVNCTTADNSDGKVLASWSAPSPPPGTGQHRYIFGLFSQQAPIKIAEITDRTNFNPTTFATQHGLIAKAYRGFRINSAESAPPAQANPNGPLKPDPSAITPLQNISV